jgi:hypothetical protein
MSTFKEIRGTLIKSVSSDPANPEIGEMWYNSTIGSLKGVVSTTGQWSSGGNTVIGGYGAAGAGTQTAGLIFGRQGEPVGGPPVSGATEEYNGTSWSEQNDLNSARRYIAGFGTQTAAVAGAGSLSSGRTADSEEYNGSAWTAGNSLNQARQGAASAGTLTAGLVFGGDQPPPTNNSVLTETYDGTSYSEVNDLNTARRFFGGCGTQTAALGFGGIGDNPSSLTNVESWDGTNWTAITSLNTAKHSGGSAGTQTQALYFGGNPNNNGTTEEWNGSSWATRASMATGRGYIAGMGTTSAALGATGYINGTPAPNRVQTEEFTGGTITQTFTTST